MTDKQKEIEREEAIEFFENEIKRNAISASVSPFDKELCKELARQDKIHNIAINALEAQEECEEVGDSFSKVLEASKNLLKKIEALPEKKAEEKSILDKVREYCETTVTETERNRPYMAACVDILSILKGE